MLGLVVIITMLPGNDQSKVWQSQIFEVGKGSGEWGVVTLIGLLTSANSPNR